MKVNKLSIKWRIFLYLILFTGIIILLLWLFQVVFLDKIYKGIKIAEIKNRSNEIVKNINSSDLPNVIEDISNDNKVCIRVLEMVDESYAIQRYSVCAIDTCVIHHIGNEKIFQLYDYAKVNNGKQLQRFITDGRNYIGISGGFFSEDELTRYKKDYPESIIYSVITKNDEGRVLFIVLNSEISPVGATVRTLNILLWVITGILVLLALALAFIISNRVSKPISNLTFGARELAKGNYDVVFNDNDYREVAELSGALNYAQQELKKVDELRRELIANISHDLRTPLTMIGGYSEAMRDIPGEITPENVQVIIDETKRLSSLVNDVLDVSKLQSGVGTMDIKPMNLTSAVKEVLERFAKLCERNGYIIEFFYEKEVTVVGDEARIMQAVYNIVGNAVTHTGEDKKVIVKQIIFSDRVRIAVTDSGEGIEPDKLPLIWDRYYKVDKVHKRSAIGTGLGLYIVKTIMELNHGGYGVESTPGEGSTFWIELPYEYDEDEHPQSADE